MHEKGKSSDERNRREKIKKAETSSIPAEVSEGELMYKRITQTSSYPKKKSFRSQLNIWKKILKRNWAQRPLDVIVQELGEDIAILPV